MMIPPYTNEDSMEIPSKRQKICTHNEDKDVAPSTVVMQNVATQIDANTVLDGKIFHPDEVDTVLPMKIERDGSMDEDAFLDPTTSTEVSPTAKNQSQLDNMTPTFLSTENLAKHDLNSLSTYVKPPMDDDSSDDLLSIASTSSNESERSQNLMQQSTSVLNETTRVENVQFETKETPELDNLVATDEVLVSPPPGVTPMAASLYPVLRGEYEIWNGQASWQGTWGFSSNAFEKEAVSKFSYKSLTDINAPTNVPKSGLYNGFFFIQPFQGKAKKVVEKHVMIKFQPTNEPDVYDVHGGGRNKFGQFKLRGQFKYGPDFLQLEKMYIT